MEKEEENVRIRGVLTYEEPVVLDTCISCGEEYPVDELVDGLCPTFYEVMISEIDLEDAL